MDDTVKINRNLKGIYFERSAMQPYAPLCADKGTLNRQHSHQYIQIIAY